MAIPRELIRSVREHRIVPFIGAGVSMGVQRGLFPSWGQLLERLARELDDEAPADAPKVRRLVELGDYLQAAEIAYKQLGAYIWNRTLRDVFRKARPRDADLAVIEGIWGLEPPLVITTNYDDVLRWAQPPNVHDVQVVANDQPEELALLHEATHTWPWVWHLHGTIQRLGTLILAGADYRRLYGEENSRTSHYNTAVLKLQQALADRPFLYIGFSLSDPYVLQQIAHVLDATKGKGAPSYALMKKGTGDAAALWSNYNIRLVEYEDHGRPLAELLQAIRAAAFPPPPPPRVATPMAAPAPTAGDEPEMEDAGYEAALGAETEESAEPAEPKKSTFVERPKLAEEYARILLSAGRLVLVAPRRGGARSLARNLATARFGDRVTWLTPPSVPGAKPEEYFAAIAGDPSVHDVLGLEAWLRDRARAMGGDHLIVVKHDGGPMDHLKTLGNLLRKLMEEYRSAPGAQRFFVLVAGSAPCAWLRFNTPDFSLFSGAPVRHVPPLSEAEVRAVLEAAGLDGGRAEEVRRATGGLPGLLEEVVAAGEGLDAATLADKLADSPAVRGMLRMRLSADDMEGVQPRRHARWAIGELLAGRPVRRLADVEDELQYAEVRLYYDGLVVANEEGATVFRCEAARIAAERAQKAEEGP